MNNETKPLYMTECCPIKNLEDLYTVIGNPPGWVDKTVDRVQRSPTVLQNVLSDCHTRLNDYTVKIRLDSKTIPKTLVCHDYKGGYLEDRYLTEVNKGNLYSFYNWSHIDIFVYFSHHFITIPPLCWTNVSHRNGVKILGTVITEFKEGEKICNEIFRDIPTMQSFARHLAKIVEIYKIDGWLLNIENPMENTVVLKSFVGYLTECVHQVDSASLVIWYDSVTEDGKLSWQNELNDKNLCFFEQCDGIFLNYVWTEQNLVKSIEKAGHRLTDIYVGVDVFGRNTFGGGQFNSYKAAEVIRRHSLSMAIFAPGWTHESIVESEKDNISLMEHFLNKDSAFWSSLWPYLYTYPITTFFETSFFRGVDTIRFNLFDQHHQLSKIVHPKYSFLIPNYTEIPTLERKCHCIRLEYEDHRSACLINKQGLGRDVLVHKLFICDIPANGQLLFYVVKKHTQGGILNLRIITCLNNGSRHVIWLNGKMHQTLVVNSSVTHINPLLKDSDIVMALKDQYTSTNTDVVAYIFYVKPCHILEIGATIEDGDAVCLEAFGVKQA
ncbi:hypothetical protein HHI36_015950 [Cryptolaemus montrouzieri]|uniref:Cytosolic endo-beta-N-acetylglucosaminidase TIM barrel domain-containing protein n=1 Tax=Cryptolaemus montrouzieri TaxID=559131 RepID=A0ABD2N7I9_9CUCU